MPGLVIRTAAAADAGALAELRARWVCGDRPDPDFEARMRAWIAAEGARRTTWLALRTGRPVGMVSLFEYRRMPKPGTADSRWGYVSNLFVHPDLRRHGIGSALLAEVITAAEARSYARLVLSPSEDALALYGRAGFVVPGGAADADALLVRRGGVGRSPSAGSGGAP